MGAAKILLTAEEFDNYPFEEDKRYELDEGELIEMTRPAYDHNDVLLTLLYKLKHYSTQTGIGKVLLSENLYALGPNTRRAPDAAVILSDRQRELPGAKVIPVIPEIVVEVLSPNETHRMIRRKLTQYFDAGVKEVWLVDPESKLVEIWKTANVVSVELNLGDSITSPLLPGFSLPLADLIA